MSLLSKRSYFPCNVKRLRVFFHYKKDRIFRFEFGQAVELLRQLRKFKSCNDMKQKNWFTVCKKTLSLKLEVAEI